MGNRITRRVLVILAILAFLAVSTVAAAHSHLNANSSDESHCPLCIAVHRGKHAVAAPVIALGFTAVQTAILVRSRILIVPFIQPHLAQDRAPPKL
jgi:hypothetical protein